MFDFPTHSITVHREDFLDWLSSHSFNPDRFFASLPLPNSLFRLTFRLGEVPECLEDARHDPPEDPS